MTDASGAACNGRLIVVDSKPDAAGIFRRQYRRCKRCGHAPLLDPLLLPEDEVDKRAPWSDKRRVKYSRTVAASRNRGKKKKGNHP